MKRALILASLLVPPAKLAAQRPDGLGGRTELRLDVRPLNAAEVGVGFAVPTTLYMRVGALVAGGAVRDGDTTRAVGRVEGFVRIPFDPLFERRWAPYVTGGGAVSCAAERRCTPLLVLRVGLEGPRQGAGSWTPALEAGVGGGLRLAVLLRRTNGPGR